MVPYLHLVFWRSLPVWGISVTPKTQLVQLVTIFWKLVYLLWCCCRPLWNLNDQVIYFFLQIIMEKDPVLVMSFAAW